MVRQKPRDQLDGLRSRVGRAAFMLDILPNHKREQTLLGAVEKMAEKVAVLMPLAVGLIRRIVGIVRAFGKGDNHGIVPWPRLDTVLAAANFASRGIGFRRECFG